MCKSWAHPKKGFAAFVAWARKGYRPELELDRRNNDGDYSPDNCRWVTHKINAQNRGDIIWVEVGGSRQELFRLWENSARVVSYNTVKLRYYRGWDVKRALSTPAKHPGAPKRVSNMKLYTALDIPTMREINALPKTFVAASLFSGCGGSSVGIKLAGGDVRYASEFVPIAADTYEANAPGTYVDRRDIREVTPEFVLKKCRVRKGELDYLDGSPPCKIFSKASIHTKGKRDETQVVLYSEGIKQRVDDLFFQFSRLLDGIQPRVFVAENVEGLTAQANRQYLHDIFQALNKCGYAVEARVIDASKLGVPQARKRLIFVGVRNDLVKKGFKPVFPKPLNRYITVQDVVPHAVKMKFGGGKGYVSAAQPSQTITASDATTYETADFSCGAFIELADGHRRKYKISEAKKVFGMPSDFKLLGDYEQKFERLGRIHVPLSVYYLASTLREKVLDRL